ncbi:hypothetical protein RvY_14459-3 [Ramazzottius varieornatus]|uniref:BTB domain-containing protein n=1 Tax=Ramazzottius varieornatus TaxID=947166 RepID=A0A1D1VRF1_RAMVA|nr:hypothetical protein RvY_14459-3 [Ramazzottius varieornatus]
MRLGMAGRRVQADGTRLPADIPTFQFNDNGNAGEIQAHKVFLAIGSEVFYAMFYGPVADVELKEVPIPNYRKENFQALVDYLYTDTVSGGLSVEAADLDRNFGILKCALQYGVPGLAFVCRQAIFDTLQNDVATACAVLVECAGAKTGRRRARRRGLVRT